MPKNNWEKVAKQFHDIYEELAPFYGYITRKETRKFDSKSNNGKLMIEVCKKVVQSQKDLSIKETLDKIEKEFNNSPWFYNNKTAFLVFNNVINNLKKSIKL